MARFTSLGRPVWVAIFTCTVVARFYLALQSSYLHPDEHLQGPQVVANGYFGWAGQATWEFTSETPIRSMVPLWIVYGLPMIMCPHDANPKYVLWGVRIWMAVLSWVLTDMAIDRLNPDKSKVRRLLFVSTSYVSLTYQTHTLSNSLETVLLMWCLVIIHEFHHVYTTPFDWHFDSALLAVLIVVGVFNRPTFLAFLALPSLQLLKFYWGHKASFLTFVFTGSLASALCIYVDTSMYNHKDWLITPWNNVMYNSQTSNLALHGLHSRLTHVLANIPQLVGPGLFFLRFKWSLSWMATISGVALLSLFPHQEARFLVPVVPLLCMNMSINLCKKRNLRVFAMCAWLLFNAALAALMGVFHQGGVLPAIHELRESESIFTSVWWKTYPPPLWQFGMSHQDVDYISLEEATLDEILAFLNNRTSKATVVDLLGCDPEILEQVLDAGNLFLVAPDYPGQDPVWYTSKHVSLDDGFRKGLGIYRFQ